MCVVFISNELRSHCINIHCHFVIIFMLFCVVFSSFRLILSFTILVFVFLSLFVCTYVVSFNYFFFVCFFTKYKLEIHLLIFFFSCCYVCFVCCILCMLVLFVCLLWLRLGGGGTSERTNRRS